mmetsp:Transcript_20896/g.53094  ORF Transcript_20896/g.53094 Transcript_20896/m.53094 type:complete len:419 (-) Transcript_20896:1236-2492(-)
MALRAELEMATPASEHHSLDTESPRALAADPVPKWDIHSQTMGTRTINVGGSHSISQTWPVQRDSGGPHHLGQLLVNARRRLRPGIQGAETLHGLELVELPTGIELLQTLLEFAQHLAAPVERPGQPAGLLGSSGNQSGGVALGDLWQAGQGRQSSHCGHLREQQHRHLHPLRRVLARDVNQRIPQHHTSPIQPVRAQWLGTQVPKSLGQHLLQLRPARGLIQHRGAVHAAFHWLPHDRLMLRPLSAENESHHAVVKVRPPPQQPLRIPTDGHILNRQVTGSLQAQIRLLQPLRVRRHLRQQPQRYKVLPAVEVVLPLAGVVEVAAQHRNRPRRIPNANSHRVESHVHGGVHHSILELQHLLAAHRQRRQVVGSRWASGPLLLILLGLVKLVPGQHVIPMPRTQHRTGPAGRGGGADE